MVRNTVMHLRKAIWAKGIDLLAVSIDMVVEVNKWISHGDYVP